MKKLILLLAAVALVSGGGAAIAAIPSSDGTILSCYGANGDVRIVDKDAGFQNGRVCNPGETALTWSQKGPAGAQGPAGAPGAKGATGAQGPAGPSFVWARFPTGKFHPVDQYTTVGTIGLDKGLYHVSAKTEAFMAEWLTIEIWSVVTCRLAQIGPNGTTVLDVSRTDISDNGPERATLALEGLMNVETNAQELRLQCKDGNEYGSEFNSLENSKLFAQQVGGYLADGS